MKTIIVEFTEQEAQQAAVCLDNESHKWDNYILECDNEGAKEQFITQKNLVDDVKNKLDRAMKNPIIKK
jgi:hypothetical protein